MLGCVSVAGHMDMERSGQKFRPATLEWIDGCHTKSALGIA